MVKMDKARDSCGPLLLHATSLLHNMQVIGQGSNSRCGINNKDDLNLLASQNYGLGVFNRRSAETKMVSDPLHQASKELTSFLFLRIAV